jgi:hypothetical protein
MNKLKNIVPMMPHKPRIHFQIFCLHSDSRSAVDSVISTVDDAKDRVHNWDVLLKNIQAYYQVSVVLLFAGRLWRFDGISVNALCPL